MQEYNGERCENQMSCAKVPCKNNGRCVEGTKGLTCHCPLGWIGPFCDKGIPFCQKNNIPILMNSSSKFKYQP